MKHSKRFSKTDYSLVSDDCPVRSHRSDETGDLETQPENFLCKIVSGKRNIIFKRNERDKNQLKDCQVGVENSDFVVARIVYDKKSQHI